MLSVEFILSLVVLGSFVGFIAGLLGVGGGGIMVPCLTALFLWQGWPKDSIVHLALGTSMASIVVTSLASMIAHHRKKGVQWSIVKPMAPGIVIGSFLSAYIAGWINPPLLAGFFSVFMAFVALQIFFDAKPPASRHLPGTLGLFTVGASIGGVSALVSIGGGSLSVPFLQRHNIPIKRAIGTSAALGFPIAVTGTFGYLLSGWNSTHETALSLGFVYLPAVLIIWTTSVFTAPMGVKLAYRLPVTIIKRVFALLLMVLSVNMVFTIAT